MANKKQPMQLNFGEFEVENTESNQPIDKNNQPIEPKAETINSFQQDPSHQPLQPESTFDVDENVSNNDFSVDIFAPERENSESDTQAPQVPKSEATGEENPFLDQHPTENISNIAEHIPVQPKKTKKTKPVIQLDTFATNTHIIESYHIRINPLVEKAEAFLSIISDNDNNNARVLAKDMANLKSEIEKARKALNKPLKDKIDENNHKAKVATEKLDNQIERIKKLITKFELEKETQRQAELKRIEDEKRKKEEEERKELERISKIKSEIQRLRQHSISSINAATSLSSIEKIQQSLNQWHPKKEYFMEFFDEVNIVLKNEISQLIQGRIPIVKKLEETMKKAAELDKVNKAEAERQRQEAQRKLIEEKQKKEQQAALEKIQQEALELSAKNEVTVLIASFGIKNIEPYIQNLFNKYGSYQKIVESRDKVIQSYHQEQESQRTKELLDAQRLKNQRIDFPFTIIDENLVPREYLCVDEAKIKKAIQENRSKLEKDINAFKIDGIVITTKTTTVLRN